MRLQIVNHFSPNQAPVDSQTAAWTWYQLTSGLTPEILDMRAQIQEQQTSHQAKMTLLHTTEPEWFDKDR